MDLIEEGRKHYRLWNTSKKINIDEAMKTLEALVDRLKDAEQVEKGLRASIQRIADELGVGDEPRCKWITIEISSLKDRLKAADERYYELIMNVVNKYPNESRHETALRYIRQAESSDNQCASEVDND